MFLYKKENIISFPIRRGFEGLNENVINNADPYSEVTDERLMMSGQ
jgi:hypothetical protein